MKNLYYVNTFELMFNDLIQTTNDLILNPYEIYDGLTEIIKNKNNISLVVFKDKDGETLRITFYTGWKDKGLLDLLSKIDSSLVEPTTQFKYLFQVEDLEKVVNKIYDLLDKLSLNFTLKSPHLDKLQIEVFKKKKNFKQSEEKEKVKKFIKDLYSSSEKISISDFLTKYIKLLLR